MARRRLLPAIVVVGLAVAGAAAQQQRPRIPPTVNTWKGFRDYVLFNRALVVAAKSGMGKKTAEEIAAELKPKFPVFTKEELLTDKEYGGTPLSRAVINVNVAFQELGKR
jgi:hypothetical protein